MGALGSGRAKRVVPRTSKAILFGAAVALLVWIVPPVANADGLLSAQAQAQFDQAAQLMKQGSYAAACPKFAESNHLDAGLGTLLHLADCYEKNGQIASAWATFADAADLSKRANDPREQLARSHMDALVPHVPHLIIQVTGAVPGEEIRVDGGIVGQPSWATSIPYDPGKHTVEAFAAGRLTVTKSVDLRQGETARITLEPLALASSSAPSSSVAPSRLAPSDVPLDSSATFQKPLGFGVAAVGVVALGVGGYFRLHATGQHNDAVSACAPWCTDDAKSLQSGAMTSATVSAVMLATGIAALGAGIVLAVTAPSTTSAALRVTPSLGRSEAGATLGGFW